MSKSQSGTNNIGRKLLLILVLCLVSTSVIAQSTTTLAEKLAEALDHRIYGRFDEGITTANQQFARSELDSQDSVAILAVLSIIYYSKGQEFFDKSYDYLEKISAVGPCVSHLPQEIWPKGLRNQWYTLLSKAGSLSCVDTSRQDLSTIAVMPFDNHSIGKYQEELGELGAGLASFFQYDFSKVSALTIVERDKIDFLIAEQKMATSGTVDQATAIRAGKILNAHLMVFGSFTQIDKKNTRLVVRAVNVETSEVIASVSLEGKPDYFKLEKELVPMLLKELEIKISGEDIEAIELGGTESLDATTLYAKGLAYEDQYDYKKAYEYFKKALDLDPEFVEAKRKTNIYHPLAT